LINEYWGLDRWRRCAVTGEVTPEQERRRDLLWAAMPRPDFTLGAQLNVDATAGDPAQIASDWVDHLTGAVGSGVRAQLAGLPGQTRAAIKTLTVGDVYGDITVTRMPAGERIRTRKRTLSDTGLDWLRTELADMPYQVDVSAGHLDEYGLIAGWTFSARIRPLPHSRGWLQLTGHLPESSFTDPDTGIGTQQRWLAALHAFADRVNPGYGQIGYHHGGGDTAVEETVDWRAFQHNRRQSDFTIGRSRDTLRGYDWVTIVPQELASTLGGAEGLAATGAFAQVRPLVRGGVALLTTADFRDYTAATAEPAFRTLAPILPPGRPLLVPRSPNQPPVIVVDLDPADL
jgi:hypothetical protein